MVSIECEKHEYPSSDEHHEFIPQAVQLSRTSIEPGQNDPRDSNSRGDLHEGVDGEGFDTADEVHHDTRKQSGKRLACSHDDRKKPGNAAKGLPVSNHMGTLLACCAISLQPHNRCQKGKAKIDEA